MLDGGTPFRNADFTENPEALVTDQGRQVVETHWQDQHTRSIDTKINIIQDLTITLAATPTVNQYDLTLTTGHGVSTGEFLAYLEQNGAPQIYFGKVLNVVVDVVTMDTPVPYPFIPADTTILKYINNLNVDGSGTTVVSSIINVFDKALDLTRFLFHITDNSAMDDALFGGIPALTRGIVLRKKLLDGNYINYFNVKTNGEFGELGHDMAYDDKAPSGFFGLRSRITYAGTGKHGVVIRLQPGEIIELLIQDNLTDLTAFIMMIQGHFTD